jgi:beta-RFAP synthase
MYRIEAPCRLHFGLLQLGIEESWANVDGVTTIPARRFGGVGLMVDAPRLAVVAEQARGWSALGPSAVRALEFAKRFVAALPGGMPPQRLLIESAPPEHIGLGAGTQLALAVAKVLALAAGHADWNALELAARVGRGRRSAVGVHGFQLGGFIVEGGKREEDRIAPLLAREGFPPEWAVIIAIPAGATGLHGDAERHALARLRESGRPGTVNALCRLVLLGLLPALAEKDFHGFSEALYDFNARAGEAFLPVQGGRYAHALGAEFVALIRGEGVAAVGQSSWGPAMFAICEDQDRARAVLELLRRRYSDDALQLHITRADNVGARG